MEVLVKVSLLGFIGLIFCCSQVNSGWLDAPTEILKREAGSVIDNGGKVMQTLESKINERRAALKQKSSQSWWLGIDFRACANMSLELAEGESLLVSGGVLFSDFKSSLDKITGCFSSMTSNQCWTLIIEQLPDLLEKYKPLTTCYFDNVYYAMEMIDYYYDDCLGGPKSPPPKAPSESFDKCVHDFK